MNSLSILQTSSTKKLCLYIEKAYHYMDMSKKLLYRQLQSKYSDLLKIWSTIYQAGKYYQQLLDYTLNYTIHVKGQKYPLSKAIKQRETVRCMSKLPLTQGGEAKGNFLSFYMHCRTQSIALNVLIVRSSNLRILTSGEYWAQHLCHGHFHVCQANTQVEMHTEESKQYNK